MITNDYSFLSNLVDNSANIRNQLAQVQEQVASGQVSNTYAGLGSGARTSLDLNPQIQHYSTYSANVDAAQGRLSVTQTALSSLSSIASDFFARVNSIDSTDPSSVSGLATLAKTALQQVGDLLNTKSGDVYVFAGTDTSNPPVPDTSSSVLSADVLASDTAQAPFSTTLNGTVPQVQVGENEYVKVGLLANANTLATSQPPTTGSYTRDIMKSLALLGNLTAGSSAATTVSSARGLISSAISAMATETGALGQIQSSLTTRQTQLNAVSTSLTTQLSSVQDVDMAAAITKSQALATQLQASYQIIAKSQSLSLSQFI